MRLLPSSLVARDGPGHGGGGGGHGGGGHGGGGHGGGGHGGGGDGGHGGGDGHGGHGGRRTRDQCRCYREDRIQLCIDEIIEICIG